MTEYQPQYKSPRPKKEDARPVRESVNAVETRVFLLSQDPDPLEIQDLVCAKSELRTLKVITRSSK